MNLALLGWSKHEICKLHETGEVELCCHFCHGTAKDKAAYLLNDRLVFRPLKLERHVLKLGEVSISCVVCNVCMLVHQMISLRGAGTPEAALGELIQN